MPHARATKRVYGLPHSRQRTTTATPAPESAAMHPAQWVINPLRRTPGESPARGTGYRAHPLYQEHGCHGSDADVLPQARRLVMAGDARQRPCSIADLTIQPNCDSAMRHPYWSAWDCAEWVSRPLCPAPSQRRACHLPPDLSRVELQVPSRGIGNSPGKDGGSHRKGRELAQEGRVRGFLCQGE